MVHALLFEHPLIMGIINVTPDSFSGDGLMAQKDYVAAATHQAQQMIEDGAHILDIGGESSRPGSAPISVDEEINRVVPVITMLRQQNITVPIAVDTVKAAVAEAALKAGADIINDISALAHDATMAAVVAKYQSWIVLMHNRADHGHVMHDAKKGGEYQAPLYEDVVHDVKHDLQHRIAVAMKAGIAADKIILDPGLGFGKTVQQNLKLIQHLDQITALGHPVLLGPSRKGFIGHVLDVPVDERLEGTAAAVAMGVAKGAVILRVHDVKFMARVVAMTDAIRKA